MTQAELFEEAARVARMVEGTGLKYWECVKYGGQIRTSPLTFVESADNYEFALALVEGKPVWKGDVLYSIIAKGHNKFTVEGLDSHGLLHGGGFHTTVNICSWSPPLLHAEWKKRYENGENLQFRNVSLKAVRLSILFAKVDNINL